MSAKGLEALGSTCSPVAEAIGVNEDLGGALRIVSQVQMKHCKSRLLGWTGSQWVAMAGRMKTRGRI
jgi:hypothetical protein